MRTNNQTNSKAIIPRPTTASQDNSWQLSNNRRRITLIALAVISGVALFTLMGLNPFLDIAITVTFGAACGLLISPTPSKKAPNIGCESIEELLKGYDVSGRDARVRDINLEEWRVTKFLTNEADGIFVERANCWQSIKDPKRTIDHGSALQMLKNATVIFASEKGEKGNCIRFDRKGLRKNNNGSSDA